MKKIIMLNKEDVGIVIVNWRSREVILECLESIKKAGYIESVVVVDNASNDGSIERIKNYVSRIKVIENEKNLGFAEGNNRGIKYCLAQEAKYVFILNPDTEINENTIPNLLEVMAKDGSIGIAGPKILAPDGKIWSAGGILEKNRYSGGLIGLGEVDRRQYDKLKEVDFISGTAMMVKREVFDKCGLFNPAYFIYYEDVDLNFAAKRAGFKIYFVPKSEILHKESSSMGENSPAQEYYMARNHLLFLERNAPLFVKMRETARLPKTVYEYWKGKEKWAIRGIIDYFLRRYSRRDYWS